MTVRTEYGYYHCKGGKDLDGSPVLFEWIEPRPMEDAEDMLPGWHSYCQVEPDAGWIGPFSTEEAAIKAATEIEAFQEHLIECCYGDDPMGEYHGRNK